MTSLSPKLSGKSLGARHREFNNYVNHAEILELPPISGAKPLDALYYIALANKQKNVTYILNTLKQQDMLYINAALRKTWLLNDDYENIINPSNLEKEIYPHMITPAVNKTNHWIAVNLRNSQRCQEFYEYHLSKNFGLAVKFLQNCSKEYVLENVINVLDKLTPHRLKVLSEKYPEVVKIYFDEIRKNESVLKKYLDREEEYFNVIKYVLKSDGDNVLNIAESFFKNYSFKAFSAEATKFIMTKHKARFSKKPELYTAWFLDIKTLAKYLDEEEIKDLVLKLARATYMDSWFEYKKVEPLFKRLNNKIRGEFKKLVFVDKLVGDKVIEWPYEIPSPPAFTQVESNIFEDKEDPSPELYMMDVMECCMRSGMQLKKRKFAHFRSARAIRPQTELDRLFERYRFSNFDKTFAELQKKMFVETQENRQYMMLVLVSKTGGLVQNVDTLMKLLVERHANEPVHLRATVMRSLAKRACMWRLPEDTWELCLKFGRDLGFDGKPPAASCIEGNHAIILRNILLEQNIQPEIWKAFLVEAFTDFKEYTLTASEIKAVAQKLPKLLLDDAKSDAAERCIRLRQLLDVLVAYKIRVHDCPGFLEAIAETKDESLLRQLYDARIARKELIKENFSIIQTDDSYLNALKHDIELLESGVQFEGMIQNGQTHLDRFMRSLSLYFVEENGLAAQYYSILINNIDKVPKKKDIGRCLAFLAGQKLMDLIKKLEEDKDASSKKLATELKANIHLVRPLIPIEDLEKFGAVAIASRVAVCSDEDVDNTMKKLIANKKTERLALMLSTRVGKEYDTFEIVAAKRPRFALKVLLKRLRKENNLDARLWDIVTEIIKDDTIFQGIADKLLWSLENTTVPLDKRAKYGTAVFKLYEKVSSEKAVIFLYKLEKIVHELDESFTQEILNDFLENKLTEEGIQLEDKLNLYVSMLAKYLMLGKSEEEMTKRFELGNRFFDRLEEMWDKVSERDILNLNECLNKFLLKLKFTKVFLDLEYVSTMKLFENISARMRKFLPMHLHISKYIRLHLTMLYCKAIRQSVKNNPGIFVDISKNVKEAVKIIGVIYGKYISNEIHVFKEQFFGSVMDIYQVELVSYLNEYFGYNDTQAIFLNNIVWGILESNSKSHRIAEYIYRTQSYSLDSSNEPKKEELFDRLKKSDDIETKFFLYSDLY